jgi:hypothetical protein
MGVAPEHPIGKVLADEGRILAPVAGSSSDDTAKSVPKALFCCPAAGAATAQAAQKRMARLWVMISSYYPCGVYQMGEV